MNKSAGFISSVLVIIIIILFLYVTFRYPEIIKEASLWLWGVLESTVKYIIAKVS